MAAPKFKVGDYVLVSYYYCDTRTVAAQYLGKVLVTYKRKRYLNIALIARKDSDGYRHVTNSTTYQLAFSNVEKIANPELVELVLTLEARPSDQETEWE